jgi:hypothetical protein
MKQISIKITGSGTPNQIAHRLLDLARAIVDATAEELAGKEWEDDILMTEINEE